MILQEPIESQKIMLRSLSLEDCSEQYLSWLQNENINQYLETRWQPQSIASIKKFVTEINESDHSYLFGIFDQSNKRHVGNIKLGPILKHHKKADVSYFIGEESSWGKGFATDAVGLVTKFAFEQLQLHKLIAGYYIVNKGSAVVLQRNNYTEEAHYIRSARYKDEWVDQIFVGILEDEWRVQNLKASTGKSHQ